MLLALLLLQSSVTLDETPVTNAQFNAFLAKNEAWRKDRVPKLFAERDYLRDIDVADPQAPVVYVSWFAARAYCASLGKRLPTTDEWERASADTNTQEILAWYARPTPKQLRKVGGPRNAQGLRDMHGLVWEWTEDFSSALVSADGRNQDGLFCGAGALGATTTPDDYARFMRKAFRGSLSGNFTLASLGFRCAR